MGATMALFCCSLNESVPSNDLIIRIDSQNGPGKRSAEFHTVEGMLRRRLRFRPFLDNGSERLTHKITTELQESVQLQHVLLVPVVPISHGSHQSQVVAHEGTKKTAESRGRPDRGKSRKRMGTEQCTYYRPGRSLAILLSQLRQRIFVERAVLYRPIEIPIHETSTMRDQVKRPNTVPSLEPFVHHVL
jgi:hypothetical protein